MPTTTAKEVKKKKGEIAQERNSLGSVSGRLEYGIAHVSSVGKCFDEYVWRANPWALLLEQDEMIEEMGAEKAGPLSTQRGEGFKKDSAHNQARVIVREGEIDQDQRRLMRVSEEICFSLIRRNMRKDLEEIQVEEAKKTATKPSQEH
jgi:hypothetical protein